MSPLQMAESSMSGRTLKIEKKLGDLQKIMVRMVIGCFRAFQRQRVPNGGFHKWGHPRWMV